MTGTWTATGSLATARYRHTATLLSNGLVLLAGGVGSSGYLASAELYYFGLGPSPGIQTLAVPSTLTAMKINGLLMLSFTNGFGLPFAVLTTTNLALPQANWKMQGAATELTPGRYQFTDAQAAGAPRRFYRVFSP